MTTRLAIDRFEDDAQQVAVLLTDDGHAINVPRALLPKGVRPGDLLRLTFERDAEGTQRLQRETQTVQDELRSRDPGGDLKL